MERLYRSGGLVSVLITACGVVQPPGRTSSDVTDVVVSNGRSEASLIESPSSGDGDPWGYSGPERCIPLPETSSRTYPQLGAPRRPLAIYTNTSMHTDIGADGAILRWSEGATLRIPAGSLPSVLAVRFVVDTTGPAKKGRDGDVYLIDVQLPAGRHKNRTQHSFRFLQSSGAPFVLTLPLSQNRSTAELALMTRGASDRPMWTMKPMTKLEIEDDQQYAVFELDVLPCPYTHLVAKP